MSLIYFIAEDGESIIALDCEQSLEISKSNTVTESSIVTGESRADGFVEGNKRIAVSGLVTYSKSASQQTQGTPDPLEFQNLLDATIRSHSRFKLYAAKGNTQFLPDINNCVIDNYNIVIDRFSNAITANLAISEVFISEAATKTELPPVASKTDKSSIPKSEKTKSSKEVVPKEDSFGLLRSIPELIGSIIRG